ncbi:hypothetical protein Bca101_073378 [Brassica carinata]
MFAASEEPDVKRLIHTTNPRESKSIIEAQDLDEVDFFLRNTTFEKIISQAKNPLVSSSFGKFVIVCVLRVRAGLQ